MPSPGDALVGQRIGNFTLVRRLGDGAMGAVYLAQHDRIERRKAVKVLHEEWTRDAGLVRRFFAEAMAATACEHDHIVTVDDCGTFVADGVARHYLLMEHLEGDDLATELARVRTLPVERAVHVAIYAADALGAAHARGIVHRDLKPPNLFLARRGHRADYVKVLDFGIARLTGELASGRPTRTGQVMGTPEYMSPEQARGLHPDGRSDIYSLGVVLYQMLSGRLPFEGQSFAVLTAEIARRDPPPLDRLVPSLPRGVVDAVERAMAKRPEDRFPSMRALCDALLARDAAPGALRPELSIDLLPSAAVAARAAGPGWDEAAEARLALAPTHPAPTLPRAGGAAVSSGFWGTVALCGLLIVAAVLYLAAF